MWFQNSKIHSSHISQEELHEQSTLNNLLSKFIFKVTF